MLAMAAETFGATGAVRATWMRRRETNGRHKENKHNQKKRWEREPFFAQTRVECRVARFFVFVRFLSWQNECVLVSITIPVFSIGRDLVDVLILLTILDKCPSAPHKPAVWCQRQGN